ncbi:MAG: GIY-YIG nuclease family protein [Clostridia bacterium]|nr:GIY-YIG nuclease family protein [Clostridia bacterium]
MAYVYILHCTGGSLYTGITTDITRRLREHADGKGVGAKYTRAHKPLGIAALWETDDLPMAARIEYRLKRLSPVKKRLLITTPEQLGREEFPLPEGVTCRVAEMPDM